MSIELNNPGNIRVSASPWQGKIVPSRSSAFETFDTPEHGLRALAKLLLTYFHEGCQNIEDIVARWAPPSENNTDAYIDAVSDSTGFDSDQTLKPDAPTLEKLVIAITHQENGQMPYSSDMIAQSVQDALA